MSATLVLWWRMGSIGAVSRTATTPAEVEQYLDALWMEKGLSENTLASYRSDLPFH